jgi:hypothetical protein
MKTKRSPSVGTRTTTKRKKSTSKKSAPVMRPKAKKGHRASTAATRIDAILTALRQSGGVTLADLTVLTGWQAHSVRATLCRLRQAGHAIASVRSDGIYRYHAEIKS